MFAGKVSWGLNDSLTLFGILLLTATFLGLSPTPFVSVGVSFIILAAYYIGTDIRKQHTEYHTIIDFEKTDNGLTKAFNLTLAGILLFGLFNVLQSYYSGPNADYMMNSSEFLSFWVKTGTLFHLKFWFDLVFLVIFAKEFLFLLFRDIIRFKMPKSEKKEEHKHQKREIRFEPEEKPSYSVKKVKVNYG